MFHLLTRQRLPSNVITSNISSKSTMNRRHISVCLTSDMNEPIDIDNNDIVKSGMDTETTSESEATALFDYTGTYRVSLISYESSLKPSQYDILSLGGYISIQPTSRDEYDIILDTHMDSNKVLQGSVSIGSCMDYIGLNMDVEESPYDDILAVKDLRWTSKNTTTDDKIRPNRQQETIDDVQILENLIVDILLKCDMIRFVGEILILEGPRGAIECTLYE